MPVPAELLLALLLEDDTLELLLDDATELLDEDILELEAEELLELTDELIDESLLDTELETLLAAELLEPVASEVDALLENWSGAASVAPPPPQAASMQLNATRTLTRDQTADIPFSNLDNSPAFPVAPAFAPTRAARLTQHMVLQIVLTMESDQYCGLTQTAAVHCVTTPSVTYIQFPQTGAQELAVSKASTRCRVYKLRYQDSLLRQYPT